MLNKVLALSPFQRILIALSLGVLVGVFLGELASPLRTVGDIYVGLLQMTVMPYIICSVIGNIGRLTVEQSKKLAVNSFAVLFLLWGVGMVTVFVVAQTLPTVSAGSFFSTSLLEPPKEFDFIKIFIPSNPFQSLSENLVPGVVLFCILVGLALMRAPEKHATLAVFDTMNETLGRVSNYVAKLSPIGVFAIAASAAGTLTLEEFGRLQAYFLVYGSAVLLLVLVVLPLLVVAITPFRYSDIISTQGNVLITALAIGSVFAVIPLLIESQKKLMATLPDYDQQDDQENFEHSAEFIIPLAYPFPHLGKVVTLIFIPFAAWFYGRPLEIFEYPAMLIAGLFLSFGKVTVTVPFLLDMQAIPADIFRLFLMSSVIAGPLSDMLGAAHLLAFTTLTTCAMSGLMKFKKIKMISTLVLGGAVTILSLGATGLTLHQVFADQYNKGNVLANMGLLQDRVENLILPVSEPNPDPLLANETLIDRIIRRGRIRVGVDPDNVPFSYYNARGNLVGHDIDLVHRMAEDLGVELEFVPINPLTMAEQISEDHFDLAASGFKINLRAFGDAIYSLPYMNVNLALVAADHDRERFASLSDLGTGSGLVLGVKNGSYFGRQIQSILPDARLVQLWSESQFFEGPPERMDALITTAEGGSAWTLIHPEFAVIDPNDSNTSAPIAVLLARADTKTAADLGTWIRLKQHDGTLKDLYRYWILGLGANNNQPRWSVIRNVLHWVD